MKSTPKIKVILSLVLVSMMLQSCSIFLRTKSQNVTINTGSRDCKVYVNDKYVGKGKEVQAKVKRGYEPHQVRVEREGYKDEFGALVLSKASPQRIIDVILSLPTLFVSSIGMVAAKGFSYKKHWTFTPKTKLLKKEEGERYIFVRNTSFEVDKEDAINEKYKAKQYFNGMEPYSTYTEKESLDYDNTVFNNTLNKILKEAGYIDTTKTIFKSRSNTLYISSTVSEINYKRVIGKVKEPFYTADIDISWTLLDVYDQELLSKKMKSSGGYFVIDSFDEYGDLVVGVIEDAIKKSFFEFLSDKEVKSILKVDLTPADVALSLLKFNYPQKNVKSLADAQNATVTVVTSEESHGSGFFVTNDGYIMTNYHVVANAKEDKLKIITNAGNELSAKIIRKDITNDLAVLKTDTENQVAFEIPTTNNYEIGQEVFAIGTPETVELGQTLSKGIVSGVRKHNDESKEWIQSDVSVNPGNSGGALVNKNGKLIGIVNSKLMGFGVEGISFIIPANVIFSFLNIEYNK